VITASFLIEPDGPVPGLLVVVPGCSYSSFPLGRSEPPLDPGWFTWAHLGTSVLDGQVREALGEEDLRLVEEGRAGLLVVESVVDLQMNSGARGVPVRLMMKWSKIRAKRATFSMSWYCGFNNLAVVRPAK
jgi:hypothetical protein